MWSPPKPWEIPSNNFRNPPPTSTGTSYRPVRGVRQVRQTNMAENDRKTAPALPPRPASRPSQSLYPNNGRLLIKILHALVRFINMLQRLIIYIKDCSIPHHVHFNI
jgi:hypothetical protein